MGNRPGRFAVMVLSATRRIEQAASIPGWDGGSARHR